MGPDDTSTSSGERTFGIDELFFSTTDSGGRMLSGNPVFVRVSAYSEDELRGRAHNIVRHPDMPRVVFRLLWEHLGGSRPIAAYVKNRAKDGRFYWVVAIVVPIEGGYLSVRFKPSGPHFAVVQSLYGELLAIEQRVEREGGSRTTAMDAAQERLQQRLGEIGLRDYDAFMHHFLVEEMRSRDAQLATSAAWGALWSNDRPEVDSDPRRTALAETLESFRRAHAGMDERSADVEEYVRLNEALGNRSRDLVGEMSLQSLNMVLAASRLGVSGAGLGAVAGLMGVEADRARALTQTLNERGDALDGVLRELGFRISLGRLQAEMAVFFAHEMLHRTGASGEAKHEDLAGNVRLLAASLADSMAEVERMSAELAQALGEMVTDIAALSRLLKVLDALQVNGMVEAARTGEAGSATQLLAEMREKVSAAREELGRLSTVAASARVRARAGGDEGLADELELIDERAALLAV